MFNVLWTIAKAIFALVVLLFVFGVIVGVMFAVGAVFIIALPYLIVTTVGAIVLCVIGEAFLSDVPTT